MVGRVWVFCNLQYQLTLISDFDFLGVDTHQTIWFEQKCLKMRLVIQILYFIISNILVLKRLVSDYILDFFWCIQTSDKEASVWKAFFCLFFMLLLYYYLFTIPCAFHMVEIFPLMEITSLLHGIVMLEEKSYWKRLIFDLTNWLLYFDKIALSKLLALSSAYVKRKWNNVEAIDQSCSVKRVFLEIHRKTPVPESLC